MPIDKAKIQEMVRKQAGIKKGGFSPVCPGVELVSMEIEGVMVDFCPQSHGIWLDSGEAASLAEGLDDFPDFAWSWSQKVKSQKKSPVYPESFLWEMPYAKGRALKVDYCEKSKGIWLDASEIRELELAVADGVSLGKRMGKMFGELSKAGYIVF